MVSPLYSRRVTGKTLENEDWNFRLPFQIFQSIFSVTDTEFQFEMKSINLDEMEISFLFSRFSF